MRIIADFLYDKKIRFGLGKKQIDEARIIEINRQDDVVHIFLQDKKDTCITLETSDIQKILQEPK